MTLDASIAAAAAALRTCFDRGGVVVVAGGAGLGVDSGLPDFRGPEGFWNAYPPYRHLGLSFMDLASPRWFEEDPSLAWGFYGHRFNLYRDTVPHEGYRILRDLAGRAKGGHFVFTSNVDGAFQKAGFADDRICEVHGSIRHFQCTTYLHGIWPCDQPVPAVIDVDPATFRAREPFPRCHCGALARPNILMFGDGDWDDARSSEQSARCQDFVADVDAGAHVVVIEGGAGRGIPTVRGFCERTVKRFKNATLVRINVREAEADDRAIAGRVISVAAGAKAALTAIRDAIDAST